MSSPEGQPNSQRPRGRWDASEDQTLKDLVAQYGDKRGPEGKWKEISQRLPGRSKKVRITVCLPLLCLTIDHLRNAGRDGFIRWTRLYAKANGLKQKIGRSCEASKSLGRDGVKSVFLPGPLMPGFR